MDCRTERNGTTRTSLRQLGRLVTRKRGGSKGAPYVSVLSIQNELCLRLEVPPGIVCRSQIFLACLRHKQAPRRLASHNALLVFS